MEVETRFARTPTGPVPFRVDGAGSRQLLIISDWGTPYGEPGVGPFEAFIAELAAREAMVVTLLDGTIGPRNTSHPGIERRIAGARAVAEAAELNNATVVGTSDGAPVAALLTAGESERFTRLILFDTFPDETRKTWALDQPSELSSALADIEEAKGQLRAAGAAFDWARGLWQEMGKRPGSDDRRPPGLLPTPDRNTPMPPFGPGPPSEGGLGELLQHIASLESATRRGGGLSAIGAATLVIEARDDHEQSVGSLGMEVAAEIPGARHRRVEGRSRWPWGEAVAALDLLTTSETQAASPLAKPAAGGARGAEAPDRVLATVLFTDIVGSTQRLAELGDAAWRDLLDRHHHAIREQLSRFDGREIDTAGDGFLAAFETPARGVRCAVAIRNEVREIGLRVRCGLHTGECERVGGKLVGIAVHIGARIAGQASADEVLVSGTVRDLVAGAGITFEDRGTATLKGLPGEWQLFAVSEATGAPG